MYSCLVGRNLGKVDYVQAYIYMQVHRQADSDVCLYFVIDFACVGHLSSTE